MLVPQNCSTCEFNFKGVCAGAMEGAPYKYGEKIIDDTKECLCGWGISYEFFVKQIDSAPWFLKIPYHQYRMPYDETIKKIKQYDRGEAIPINLFFAIRYIYKLDYYKLADVLNIKPSVLNFAEIRYVPDKRRVHFSNILHIPNKFYLSFTSLDLPELEQCAVEFKKRHPEIYKDEAVSALSGIDKRFDIPTVNNDLESNRNRELPIHSKKRPILEKKCEYVTHEYVWRTEEYDDIILVANFSEEDEEPFLNISIRLSDDDGMQYYVLGMFVNEESNQLLESVIRDIIKSGTLDEIIRDILAEENS